MIKNDEGQVCQVCGRQWARFNYKAVVCDNCRVFFFRKITLNRQYRCQNGNKCSISSKVRVNCSACRFQRCLDAKMDPEEVGKRFDKRPVVQTFSKKCVKMNITQLHEPLVAYGCKILPLIGSTTSAWEYIQIMIEFERFTNNYTGESPQNATARMDISLGEAINNPSLCCKRDTAAFSDVGSLPNLSKIHFWKIFCRTLTAYLDFISGIEELQKLDALDRIKICQYNVLDFVKYNLCYLQFDSKRKHYPFTGISNFILEGAPDNFWDSYPSGYMNSHRAIVNFFAELDITQEETMFLKILGMLSAPPDLSEKGQLIIIQAKERYSVLLGELIRERKKGSTKYEILTRVRRLLTIISLVKENSIIGAQKQAEMVINGYGNMGNQLAFDIHIRNY